MPITGALQPSQSLTAFLVAGLVIGLLGVVLFGAVHAAIIVPIWTSLLGGIPFGVVAGLAMAWALYELRAFGRLGTGLIAGLAFGFMLWVTVLPMTMFDVAIRAAGMHGPDDAWEVVVELLLAIGAGAATGGLIGRRWRAALAFGAASLALALAQGGPIPVLKSTRAALLFAGVSAMYLCCGLALGLAASLASKSLRSPSM